MRTNDWLTAPATRKCGPSATPPSAETVWTMPPKNALDAL
jgi:hypothetical protein